MRDLELVGCGGCGGCSAVESVGGVEIERGEVVVVVVDVVLLKM